MAKALELFGVEETPRGLVDGDYRKDILVWGQQKARTMEVYGVEELILAPKFLLTGKGKEVVRYLKENVNDISILAPGENEWTLVATMDQDGENSTFFKAISKILLGKETTDGVNQVRKYEGEPLPVVVK